MNLVTDSHDDRSPSDDANLAEDNAQDTGDTLVAISPEDTPASPTAGVWPPEADLIISAIEAGRGLALRDRRGTSRQPYRTVAVLRLFSDLEGTDPWELYTRDVDSRGVGFITRHRLPLGYGGIIRFALPDGTETQAHCTLLRCREAAPGWFEGALYFNREQQLNL